MFGNVKCPECSHTQKMRIPKDKCIPFFKCSKCRKMIFARKLCCVFCEFGDRKCPVANSHKAF